jgi:RND family efflux transporter MFP subunit
LASFRAAPDNAVPRLNARTAGRSAIAPSHGERAPGRNRAARAAGGFVQAVLTCLALSGCGGEEASSEQPVRSIAWARAEPADGQVVRTLPGRIEAPTSVGIGFDVVGRVESIEVDIGDRFAADDVLATLDAHQYRNRVESLRAELASARARLEQARSEHARQQRLNTQGAAAEAALDRAKETLATARAGVRAAEAELQTAREDLDETRLRAPYAGAVTARHAAPGERVAPSAPVVEVVRTGGLEVRINVPETLIDQVARGQRHAVASPGRDPGPVQARVVRIGAGGDRRGLFPVDLAVDEPPAALRPGMTATVRLRLPGGDDLLAIPTTAYAAGPDQQAYTFVVDEAASVVRRREIDLAHITDERAVVASGLTAGEIVAARGLAFLSDGERVRRLGVGVRRFDNEEKAQ